MKELNRIGLSDKDSKVLVDKLNRLLSDYQMFYQNTRGFHWNIKGEKFFELHLKFEELYTDLQLKIDEVAERILTLGGVPLHSFKDYIDNSDIREAVNYSDGAGCVKSILDSLKSILIIEREILKLSAEVDDEGTNAQMSDYIREQEKLVWMYSSFLKV